MYRAICSAAIIVLIAGCVSEPARLRPGAWDMIKYGDYYLKQDPPNGPMALKLYERASQKGNDWAQFKAAELLNSGKYGAPKDREKAIEYYKLSSQEGNSFATFRLATAYKDGSGVVANRDEALRLARLAHSQSKKVNEYINMFLYNFLKDTDPGEANGYLIEAAKAGFKNAQDTVAAKGIKL